MRWIAVAVIWFYRFAVRPLRRRRCLFADHCSSHVEHATRQHGVRAGITALRTRMRQCHSGYKFVQPSPDDDCCMLCSDGSRFSASALSTSALAEMNGDVQFPPIPLQTLILEL